LINQIIR